MNRRDWDKTGGLFCPQCRVETVRLIHDLCPDCYHEKDAKEIGKIQKRQNKSYYGNAIRKGYVKLGEMKKL